MKTHGDYKARIDKLMGIKSQENAPVIEDRNMTKLKRKLRDQKTINQSLRKSIAEHEKAREK